MLVKVKHTQAVWETATFEAEVPDGEEPYAYVREHLDELMEVGLADLPNGSLENGEDVSDVDDSLSLFAADGRRIPPP